MAVMTEIEAIHSRHSVRAYLDKAIEPDKITALNELISECNEKGNLHLQLLTDAGKTFDRLLNKAMGLWTSGGRPFRADRSSGGGLGSAPSVIACIGRDDGTLEERIGYYGEKIVLLAQKLGLNTCWAGTFNAKNVRAEIRPGERLVIVIAIGYGKDSGRPHKSKTFDQVASGPAVQPDWFRKGVELALLAPTAINQQRYEIRLNEDGTVTFTDRRGPFSKVDLGIVKYHFEVGSGLRQGEPGSAL